VLNQPYRNIEVLIMDDGSIDTTLSIAKEYAACDSRVRVFFQHNKGPSEARNRLIELSMGDYIAICDADDYNCTDRFVSQVEYLEAHKDIDLVSGGLAKISQSGKIIFATKKRHNLDCGKMILKGIKNPIPHGGIMFRRTIVEKIDKPFYRRVVGEDIEVLARLLYVGCRFACTDGFVYYYQMGSLLQESFHKNVVRDKEREVIAELVADGKILDREESERRYANINVAVSANCLRCVKFKITRLFFGIFARYIWYIWPCALRRVVYDVVLAMHLGVDNVYLYDEIDAINKRKTID